MLLKDTKQKVGIDKVLTEDEYDIAILETMAKDNNVKDLYQVNEICSKISLFWWTTKIRQEKLHFI